MTLRFTERKIEDRQVRALAIYVFFRIGSGSNMIS